MNRRQEFERSRNYVQARSLAVTMAGVSMVKQIISDARLQGFQTDKLGEISLLVDSWLKDARTELIEREAVAGKQPGA